MNDKARDIRQFPADALLEECLWALNAKPNFPYATHVSPEDWTPEFKSEKRTSYDLASRIDKYFRRAA